MFRAKIRAKKDDQPLTMNGTWILVVVLALILTYAQHRSDHRVQGVLQILQVFDASKIGVDMLLERSPIVVFDNTRHAVPTFIMHVLFPWSRTRTEGDNGITARAQDACLTCISADRATHVDMAHPWSPNRFVRVLLQGPDKTLVLPRYFSYVLPGGPSFRIHERFSTLTFVENIIKENGCF